MNRRLWFVVMVSVVAVAASVALLNGRPAGPPALSTSPSNPALVPCSRLPRLLFERGEYAGQVVQVGFELPLTPTGDPLIWEYRPGVPSDIIPPTYRIVFERPPAFCPNPPVVVFGTVSRFEVDAARRLSRVPGVVVLTRASVVAPTSR